MATTKSYTLTDKAIGIIDQRSGSKRAGLRSGSQVASAVVERYRELMREHIPEFSPDEWEIIVDALNGPTREAWAIGVVNHAIVNRITGNGLAGKSAVDVDVLVKKLRKLGYAEQAALVDAVEVYKAAVHRGDKPKMPGA